jgi:hypothetical protein
MRNDNVARTALGEFVGRVPGEAHEEHRTQVVDLITCLLFLVSDPREVIREAGREFIIEDAAWADQDGRG